MHIPSSMLNGSVCPVTAAVAAAGIGLAIYKARQSKEEISISKFASVTALIFVLQMLNYPVMSGVSGHLIGGILAVSLLEIPLAILAMTVVLSVQAFFFGDGGMNTLGANIINMAFIGAGLGGMVFNYFQQKFTQKSALFLSSVFSVLAVSLACSMEVAFSGAISFNKFLMAMVSIHSLIGFGEGLLTVLVFKAVMSFNKAGDKKLAITCGSLSLLALGISPLASKWPDGLQFVAQQFSIAQVETFHSPAFSTMLVGFIGGMMIFGTSLLFSKTLKTQFVKNSLRK